MITRLKGSHYCRFLNITPVLLGIRNEATQISGGASSPFSNFISYVTSRWASRALTSLTAKNRPGLMTKRGYTRDHEKKKGQKCLPCVSPQTKTQVFSRDSDRLMSAAGCFVPFFLAEPGKAKPIKFVGVLIDFSVRLSGIHWDGDERAWGNSDSIGKCERLQHKPSHGNW